jgi:hypothetical protein
LPAFDLSFGVVPALPQKWYRVSGGGEERHFCSTTCIRRYYSSNDGRELNAKVTMPEVTIKGETGCLGL